MSARRSFGLALLLGITIFATTANGQTSYQSSTNPRDWINYGDNIWRSGSPQAALPYYNWAYYLAAYSYEPYSMVDLATRYLMLRNEQAALDCYARGKSYAYFWMNRDPGRGQVWTYGLNGLKYLVGYYNNTIRAVAASQGTQQQLRFQAVEASNVVMANDPLVKRQKELENLKPSDISPVPRGLVPQCPSKSSSPNWDDLPCRP